ncbi:MAG TPA: hypothetical protein VMR62_30490 [Bryobacteraceae bacterium]|jgi:hypothetical protein|nr:hypothetical protein [Bryobacteraceae bacterium]
MSMRDLHREMEALSVDTALARHDFVRVELQTCFLTVEMAKFELSVGGASQ